MHWQSCWVEMFLTDLRHELESSSEPWNSPCGISVMRERWLFSCMLPPCRCTSVLPSAFFSPVKFLTSEARSPPKRPLNGYMRYVQQQKPIMARQNPGMHCHTAGWSAWTSRHVNIQTGKGLNLVYMKAVKWQWWAEATLCILLQKMNIEDVAIY